MGDQQVALTYVCVMRYLVLTALLLTLIGCGAATTADWRRCSFDVTEVAFQGLRENQAEWRIVLSAINPNAKNLRLEGLHLWALMEGDTLARLRNPGRIDLPGRDTTEVTLHVSVPPAAWNAALRQITRGGSSEVFITGDVEVPGMFGTRRVRNAVRETHTINLSSLMGAGDFLRGLFR